MKYMPTLSLVAFGLGCLCTVTRAETPQPLPLSPDQQEQLSARRLGAAGQAQQELASRQADASGERIGGPADIDGRNVERRRTVTYRIDCLDCSLPGVVVRPVKINNQGVVAANDISTGQGYVIAGGVLAPTPRVAGATSSTVSDINDAGHLVGVQANASSIVGGYLGWPGGVTLLQGPDGDLVRPSGINAADQVCASTFQRSVLYERGVAHALPAPPGQSISWSTGINISGHVVGGSYSGGTYSNPDGWRYAAGTITVLSPEFVSTYANAVNDLDEVAGSVDSYAAYWNASGRLQILNGLPGFSTGMATGLNIHGTVVGILAANNSSAYPRIEFVWDGGKPHDLNSLIQGGTTTGWVLNEADSLNDRGAIVGVGLLHGESHAFVATPTMR